MVRLTYYTDPACPWSWAAEPALRRLQMEFGDEARITYVMAIPGSGAIAHPVGRTRHASPYPRVLREVSGKVPPDLPRPEQVGGFGELWSAG
jgi:protein-disulfide isomerase-like protein with CxxC motif